MDQEVEVFPCLILADLVHQVDLTIFPFLLRSEVEAKLLGLDRQCLLTMGFVYFVFSLASLLLLLFCYYEGLAVEFFNSRQGRTKCREVWDMFGLSFIHDTVHFLWPLF